LSKNQLAALCGDHNNSSYKNTTNQLTRQVTTKTHCEKMIETWDVQYKFNQSINQSSHEWQTHCQSLQHFNHQLHRLEPATTSLPGML